LDVTGSESVAESDAEHVRKPQPYTGVARIWYALTYSLSGLGFAIRHEAAFRQEVALCAALSVIALSLPVSTVYKLLLLSSHFGVMIVELLNTAIECVVDKASPEFHELAKQAKDLGSAAVLLSLLYLGICWATVVVSML